jgi:hypothetical protein
MPSIIAQSIPGVVIFLQSFGDGGIVAVVFVQFTEPVASGDGRIWSARACGSEASGGLWQGWIEFIPADGDEPVRSGRETTQPNRTDLMYWATGLTPVYLEGALRRALTPLVIPPPAPTPAPLFDGPAPDIATAPPSATSVLNPFSVIQKGEDLLRRQLRALSSWHLVNIVHAHALSALGSDALNAMTHPELVELIVAGVRVRTEVPTGR